MKFHPRFPSSAKKKPVRALIFVFILTSALAFFLFVFDRNVDDQAHRLQRDLAKKMENYKRQLEAEEAEESNNKEDDPMEADFEIFSELDANEIRIDNDVFFFVSNGAKDLSPLEACSVESAALHNVGKKVFVLFITEHVADILDSDTMSYLLSYTNVYFRWIRASKYFMSQRNTKNWFVESDFQKSEHFQKFLNDALTYTFLYKFGGTVSSFDILLKRYNENLARATNLIWSFFLAEAPAPTLQVMKVVVVVSDTKFNFTY